MTKIYDNSLNQDAAHPHVVAARKLGEAWAEREWDALSAQQRKEQAAAGQWWPSAVDALPLVRFPPQTSLPDEYERELELSEICNDSAESRWISLCNAHLDDDD